MKIFETVKSRVSVRQAAEYYGLTVTGRGMICCPFHADRHPSMKVDERYYCFSCHVTGDVIDFAARLFALSPYEAAKKLACDFHIDPTTPGACAMKLAAYKAAASQRKRESDCAARLIDCEAALKACRTRFAPCFPEAEWDARYVAVCDWLPRVSETIDCLYAADAQVRAKTLADVEESGMAEEIENKLNKWKAQDKKAQDKKAQDKKAQDKKAQDKKAQDKKAQDEKADGGVYGADGGVYEGVYNEGKDNEGEDNEGEEDERGYDEGKDDEGRDGEGAWHERKGHAA